MMISPETYYEMNLKGKNARQIMSAIRGLKNEIGHLKNIMEHPDYGSEPIMCPSESIVDDIMTAILKFNRKDCVL